MQCYIHEAIVHFNRLGSCVFYIPLVNACFIPFKIICILQTNEIYVQWGGGGVDYEKCFLNLFHEYLNDDGTM